MINKIVCICPIYQKNSLAHDCLPLFHISGGWGRGLINHYYHHFNIIFNISRCLNVMMSNSDYLFNPPPFQVQPLDSQISLHIHNKTNDGHNTHIQTEAFFSHMYNTL